MFMPPFKTIAIEVQLNIGTQSHITELRFERNTNLKFVIFKVDIYILFIVFQSIINLYYIE